MGPYSILEYVNVLNQVSSKTTVFIYLLHYFVLISVNRHSFSWCGFSFLHDCKFHIFLDQIYIKR